jgi:hypothetical protein
VARSCPRRVMWPPSAVRLVPLVVPAATHTALDVVVAGAGIPGDEAQVAYPIPTSPTSIDSTVGASDVRGQEVTRHITRAPIHSLAAPKPNATTDLNRGQEDASVVEISNFLRRRTLSGYHGQGRALDCMISDSTVGWEIARWVRTHAKELGAMEVICRQDIWTVQRSSDRWRSMSDRGSPTANHMDHVDAAVYRKSGTA